MAIFSWAMNNEILLIGSKDFTQRHAKQLSAFSIQEYCVETDNPTPPDFRELRKTILLEMNTQTARITEDVIRHGRETAIFGLHKCNLEALQWLQNLSVESNSKLVNGQSLLFNPIIYQSKKDLTNCQLTKLEQKTRTTISSLSIFNCIEFLIRLAKSPVLKTTVKAIRFQDEINILFATLYFENGQMSYIEMNNCLEVTELKLQTANNHSCIVFDLLSMNGLKKETSIEPTTENYYTKHRDALPNVVQYLQADLEQEIHKQLQFEYTIQAKEVILKIEQQLRRELPNFTHFN